MTDFVEIGYCKRRMLNPCYRRRPPPPPKLPPKKEVTFSKSVIVRTFDPATSRKRRNILWYSAEEIREQRTWDLGIASLVQKCPSPNTLIDDLEASGTWTAVGLDAVFDRCAPILENRRRGLEAVLGEQKWHQKWCILEKVDGCDHEKSPRSNSKNGANATELARVYHDATRHCQTEARHRASVDGKPNCRIAFHNDPITKLHTEWRSNRPDLDGQQECRRKKLRMR